VAALGPLRDLRGIGSTGRLTRVKVTATPSAAVLKVTLTATAVITHARHLCAGDRRRQEVQAATFLHSAAHAAHASPHALQAACLSACLRHSVSQS
jgi:hypothetical protein